MEVRWPCRANERQPLAETGNEEREALTMKAASALLGKEKRVMKRKNRVIGGLAAPILLTALLVSCGSITNLKVLYQLPQSSTQFSGRDVYFVLEDARPSRNILGEGARRELKNFPGNIIYSIAKYQQSGFRLGPYPLTDVVKDGFKRRLENMGFRVLTAPGTSVPQVTIVLQEFSMNFLNRKWVASMRYEARLLNNGKLLATQSISAQTERYKVVGKKGADEALGELFTDAVNRLNVGRLFEQGRIL